MSTNGSSRQAVLDAVFDGSLDVDERNVVVSERPCRRCASEPGLLSPTKCGKDPSDFKDASWKESPVGSVR